MKSLTRKITINVSESFYQALVLAAGPQDLGSFIESSLGDLIHTEKNLAAGYAAMAADEAREKAARDWLQIAGKALSKHLPSW